METTATFIEPLTEPKVLLELSQEQAEKLFALLGMCNTFIYDDIYHSLKKLPIQKYDLKGIGLLYGNTTIDLTSVEFIPLN